MALQNVDELRAGRPGEVLRIIIDPEMTRESLVALVYTYKYTHDLVFDHYKFHKN